MTPWRHNRDVKINIVTQNHIYFIWENFCFNKKCHFSIAPCLIHKIQLRDFDLTQTAWHRDVMTSRHDVTNLIFPISACRCARKMILFLFLWYFGLLSLKMLSVLYLHDDVTSWRHVMTSKTGCTLSQLVEVLERWLFFCFYSFSGLLSSKMLSFLCLHDVMTSRRDVVTSQNSLLYQLVDVLKWWYTFISVDISVTGFQAIMVYVLAWCLHVIKWHH